MASSAGSSVNAETRACNWPVMEEDTVCLIPVPCGIQDGILKKKVSHSNETDGNPTFKLYIIFIFIFYYIVVILKEKLTG